MSGGGRRLLRCIQLRIPKGRHYVLLAAPAGLAPARLSFYLARLFQAGLCRCSYRFHRQLEFSSQKNERRRPRARCMEELARRRRAFSSFLPTTLYRCWRDLSAYWPRTPLDVLTVPLLPDTDVCWRNAAGCALNSNSIISLSRRISRANLAEKDIVHILLPNFTRKSTDSMKTKFLAETRYPDAMNQFYR